VSTTVLAGVLCDRPTPTEGWVAIDSGAIVDRREGRAPGGATDLGPALLAPGFVDLQVNGVGDVDFASADPDGWRRAGRSLLATGVTTYLPTVVTAPLEAYEPVLRAIEQARRAAGESGLPRIAGAHLEGPFLGGAPGAHPIELVRGADPGWLAALLDAVPEVVRLVTIAPEADPGSAAMRLLTTRGVSVALGHSTASYGEAVAAADAGARLVTHAFNGMGPLHHREPGLVGAALDDDRLVPTLIPDLVHVHPAVLRVVARVKRNVALVTDAVAVGPEGADPDGGVRLDDGRLAGSTLRMDQALRNAVAIGLPLPRAIEMITEVPAAAVGLTDRGRLQPGSLADLVALDPHSLQVQSVWLDGHQVVGERR
jgi:N-acetylglucosamine-6-phosphate deacetylase